MGCGSSSEVEASIVVQSKPSVPKTVDNVESYDLSRFKPKSDAKILDPNDYNLMSYLQEGGMGKVYMAVCKLTGRKVAMKFFGYTVAKPNMGDIESEIEVMDFLNGTVGIINFYGIFLDDPAGYIENKNYKNAYPVIVMELVEGGELTERIYSQTSVTEKYLAKIFKKVASILVELEKHRIIHRDIKLENVMLLTDEEDSPVKLIDFGLMVHIPEGKNVYTNFTLKGTNGCFAPESIIESVYSAQTDVWQAGCTLYSMLSGLAPYDPDKMYQITHGSYFDMTGVGWDRISDAAKDLVSRTLQKDPSERITAAQVLSHPWIISEAPDDNLGEEYALRIKQLALRQKLRSFFLDHNIARSNMDRRDKIRKALPFLYEVMEGDGADGTEDDDSCPQRVQRQQSSDEFTFKMKNLKKVIVGSWSQHNAAKLKSENDIDISSYAPDSIDGLLHTVREDDVPSGAPPATEDSPSQGAHRLPLSIRTKSCGPNISVSCHQDDIAVGNKSSPMSPIRGTKKRGEMSFQAGNSPKLLFTRAKSENTRRFNDLLRRHSSGSDADPVRAQGGRRGASIYDGRVTGRGLSQLVTRVVSVDTTDSKKTDDGASNSEVDYVLPPGEITYDTFLEVMVKCGLSELADLSVFHIFDSGNTGSINMKEFLLTMLAFKPGGGMNALSESDEDSAARLYFQIFDIEETGYISKEELKLAVSVLLEVENGIVLDEPAHAPRVDTEDAGGLNGEVVLELLPPIQESVEGAADTHLKLFMKAHTPAKPVRSISESTPTSVPEMEELFDIIDVKKSGRINFEEFKSFYHTVLHHSVRRVTAYPPPESPLANVKGNEDDNSRG